MQPSKTRADLWMDVALMAFLIAIDVAARLLPHAPGVWPVAATALFAGRTFRIPALALIVPLVATALSNVALPGEDWRVTLVVYAAILVPALAGMASRRWRGALPGSRPRCDRSRRRRPRPRRGPPRSSRSDARRGRAR